MSRLCDACRGHLGFASIKAAIDSKPFHSTIAISPSTNSSGTPQASSPSDASGSSAPSYNVVETAVAAAMSPRATQAQTQALVGVFGGGGVAGSDGGVRFNFGGFKPHPRRVTWGSVGEGDRAAKVGGCSEARNCSGTRAVLLLQHTL